MSEPIDCCDMQCPMPLLTLKLSLKKAKMGEQIQLLLKDAASLQERDAEWENKRRRRAGKEEIEPLYRIEDVDDVLGACKGIDYHQRIGITEANLSILKTGKAKAVRFSTLEALCNELDCQPGDILEFATAD